jgi:hypothetical protein
MRTDYDQSQLVLPLETTIFDYQTIDYQTTIQPCRRYYFYTKIEMFTISRLTLTNDLWFTCGLAGSKNYDKIKNVIAVCYSSSKYYNIPFSIALSEIL